MSDHAIILGGSNSISGCLPAEAIRDPDNREDSAAQGAANKLSRDKDNTHSDLGRLLF